MGYRGQAVQVVKVPVADGGIGVAEGVPSSQGIVGIGKDPGSGGYVPRPVGRVVVAGDGSLVGAAGKIGD
jgi:hypothetical protein